jgi:sialic acid synthase SpsE
MKEIRIGNRTLRKNDLTQPYFVAEAGVNHEGDLEKAKQMIREVAKAGGDAIKFQAYKAETLASKNSPAYWDLTAESTKSQYELFKKWDSFWKSEFEELAAYAKKCNIDFTATPFDIESADFLEPIVPFYKVASADITNEPFLKHIAKKGKPILLSTGASEVSEILTAINWIQAEGNEKVALLHCVLSYPTKYENANLGMIRGMNETFKDFIIGYSDHTPANRATDILTTAWLLGAQIIEKHYTWNKSLSGNDHYHSMAYADLKKFIAQVRFIRTTIGKFNKECLRCEDVSRVFARRSIVARNFIPKGKLIAESDVTWKRPGTGIPPWMLEQVIGGKALEDILEDEAIVLEKIRLNQNRIEK